MAWILGQQGRHSEAEQAYRQVLADRQRTLGDDHPDTAGTQEELTRMINRERKSP
jgi:hypothetical protein